MRAPGFQAHCGLIWYGSVICTRFHVMIDMRDLYYIYIYISQPTDVCHLGQEDHYMDDVCTSLRNRYSTTAAIRVQSLLYVPIALLYAPGTLYVRTFS